MTTEEKVKSLISEIKKKAPYQKVDNAFIEKCCMIIAQDFHDREVIPTDRNLLTLVI